MRERRMGDDVGKKKVRRRERDEGCTRKKG
jgi:hypothetical protein